MQQMLSRKASFNFHGEDSSYFLGWKNPNVTHFKEDISGYSSLSSSLFRELALFQDYHGLPAFKKELAELMGEIRGNTVSYDPKKLLLTAGATPANETLMFCLAEPGEAFLIPTPYYPG